METKTKQGSLEMMCAMLISGSIGWFVLTSEQSLFNLIFWRCIFGAIVLLVVCIMWGAFEKTRWSLAKFFLASLSGVTVVLNWLLLFNAYQYTSISIATVVYNTQPFMLMILGAIFLSETITTRKLFWVGLAFLGVLLVVIGVTTQQHTVSYTGYILGIGLALGAAFLYAISAIIIKRLQSVSPYMIALIHVIIGMIILLPFVDFQVNPTAVQWGKLMTIGFIHTGVMYILLYSAIQKLPTHLIGSLSFIYPITALVVDRLVLGYQWTWLQFIGSCIILFCVAGVNFDWDLNSFRQKIVSKILYPSS